MVGRWELWVGNHARVREVVLTEHPAACRPASCARSKSGWLIRAVLVAGIALGFALAPATAGERSRRDSRQDAAAGGGVVSEARGEAAGHGSGSRASSDTSASVEPGSGKARAEGRGRGGSGSDGRASISVSGDGSEKVSTDAGAGGTSRGRAATDVSAKGEADLSSGASSVGSVARGKAGQSYVNSRTQLKGKSTSDEVEAEAGADAASDRKKPSRAGTSAQVRRSETLIGSKVRSSGSGNDVSAAVARGSIRVERSGQTIETVSKAETASSKGSVAEHRQVVISNGKAVYARTTSRARSTGISLLDPTATAETRAPTARAGSVFRGDRAARRLGEQSSDSFMMLELD